MTFQEILARVKESFRNADTQAIPGRLAIQFNLTGENGGVFYAEVKEHILSIEPYEYHDRDVALNISTDDFLKVLDRKLDPVFAFTVGKLKVDGDIGKALEINKLLR